VLLNSSTGCSPETVEALDVPANMLGQMIELGLPLAMKDLSDYCGLFVAVLRG
jgi:hypothetical protein